MIMATSEQHDLQDPRLVEEARAYALAEMEDPEMQAYYDQEAQKQGKSAYALAFASYFMVRRTLEE
jgi:hypothetical protein